MGPKRSIWKPEREYWDILGLSSLCATVTEKIQSCCGGRTTISRLAWGTGGGGLAAPYLESGSWAASSQQGQRSGPRASPSGQWSAHPWKRGNVPFFYGQRGQREVGELWKRPAWTTWEGDWVPVSQTPSSIPGSYGLLARHIFCASSFLSMKQEGLYVSNGRSLISEALWNVIFCKRFIKERGDRCKMLFPLTLSQNYFL